MKLSKNKFEIFLSKLCKFWKGAAPFFKYCDFGQDENGVAVFGEETDVTFIGCYFTSNNNYSIDISKSKGEASSDCKIKDNQQLEFSTLNSLTVDLVDFFLPGNEDNGAQIGINSNVSMKNLHNGEPRKQKTAPSSITQTWSARIATLN